MISSRDDRDFGSTQILIANFASKCWSAMDGDVSTVGPPITFKSITFSREATWVTTWGKT
jgi:hypothetical protein